MFSNQNTPPSNFWQQISHTVASIPANNLSIDSCFSHAFTVFYSPTWNARSSKFWQQISLPVLQALADYWSQQVWIISKVPLMLGPQLSATSIHWCNYNGLRMNRKCKLQEHLHQLDELPDQLISLGVKPGSQYDAHASVASRALRWRWNRLDF